jgi:hypothetical protein
MLTRRYPGSCLHRKSARMFWLALPVTDPQTRSRHLSASAERTAVEIVHKV